MAMPQPSGDFHDRLNRVEDAVQEFRFVHRYKTEAQTAGLAIVYAKQERMQEEIAGFRAEVHAELETIKSEQARQGGVLDEILRRLSS